MAADDTPRISLSRDALRADLAEMELRLRVYFDAQLAHKANVADLQSADHQRWVESIVSAQFAQVERSGWTRRERGLALLNLCMTAVMVAVAVRGGRL